MCCLVLLIFNATFKEHKHINWSIYLKLENNEKESSQIFSLLWSVRIMYYFPDHAWFYLFNSRFCARVNIV